MTGRPYIRPVQRYSWWLSRPRYIRYMLREISSAFFAAYMVLLIVGLLRLGQGPAEYESFLAAVRSPAGIAFSLITFAFAVYHSVTWFRVTPKAMPLWIGGKAVAPTVIVVAHWLGWAVVSVLILLWAGG